MVDGCPVSSDVVAGMWFNRKYNSTATHLYTFCMTSQQDNYLATSGGEIQVRRLPGDQSENEEIRFEVHDRSWIESHNVPAPIPKMHQSHIPQCNIL